MGFTNSPFLPIGGGTNAFGTNSLTLTTNFVSQTIITKDYIGDYVLLPTNLCSVQILFSQLTNVLSFTNQLVTVSNTAAGSNPSGGVVSFTQSLVTYFTNHVFVVNPVLCATNALGWHQGVEKVTFVRIPDNAVDELTGLLYVPLNDNYTTTTLIRRTTSSLRKEIKGKSKPRTCSSPPGTMREILARRLSRSEASSGTNPLPQYRLWRPGLPGVGRARHHSAWNRLHVHKVGPSLKTVFRIRPSSRRNRCKSRC